jgi:hypothetical protein
MATTTNYGWTTPDDTALVKDGAAAIRTLGSSVDTTTKALNPSTTLGDIEYRSSTANTNTRVGIGTTGQVLAVSGGVPAWTTLSSASALTFITGASFSTVTSVSLPNDTFSSTYLNYRVIFNVTAASGATTPGFRLRAAGTDNSAANYFSGSLYSYYGGNGAASTNAGTRIDWGVIGSGSAQQQQFEMTVFSPKASVFTVFNALGGFEDFKLNVMTGFHNTTTAFDSLTFYSSNSQTLTGSYKVYGIANS